MKEWNRDLFDPKKAAMESDEDRSPKEGNNFGFAFNDNNFSDRVLRIEIMAKPSDAKCDGDDCCSLLDWAHHRKHHREDLKKDQGPIKEATAAIAVTLGVRRFSHDLDPQNSVRKIVVIESKPKVITFLRRPIFIGFHGRLLRIKQVPIPLLHGSLKVPEFGLVQFVNPNLSSTMFVLVCLLEEEEEDKE
ncbi:hypothetical protein Cgig2_020788 [Carnegiea gigantea]|uniref:Uncharacterized protein n=1 Tax=Carnegiea gigantea TaxID=171969 RepID=A0A9Q1GJ18_9CARY|nr:hypothetical protein Cgig2_020788 [Carnegiea gigantea]